MATGPQFSLAQLVTLAQQAGWSQQDAPTIAAVAMAESGGRAGALNNNPATGDLSYGLTQVNMIDRLGPARRQQFGLSSNDDLYDPLVNLRAAKAIKDSQGWGAWSVVKGGQYRQYLPAAQQAAATGGEPLALDSLGGSSSAAPAASRARGFDLGALAAAGLEASATGPERFAGNAELAPALIAAVLGSGSAAAAPARAEAAAPAAAPGLAAPGDLIYEQGGIGPGGANHFGPHFDIKGLDGSYFERASLDPYVQVNGRPLSQGVTVRGGEFGATRDGGARQHAGWDYAFGGPAALRLANGARWVSVSPTAYGDKAVFVTPEGRQFAILHGRARAPGS